MDFRIVNIASVAELIVNGRSVDSVKSRGCVGFGRIQAIEITDPYPAIAYVVEEATNVDSFSRSICFTRFYVCLILPGFKPVCVYSVQSEVGEMVRLGSLKMVGSELHFIIHRPISEIDCVTPCSEGERLVNIPLYQEGLQTDQLLLYLEKLREGFHYYRTLTDLLCE